MEPAAISAQLFRHCVILQTLLRCSPVYIGMHSAMLGSAPLWLMMLLVHKYICELRGYVKKHPRNEVQKIK